MLKGEDQSSSSSTHDKPGGYDSLSITLVGQSQDQGITVANCTVRLVEKMSNPTSAFNGKSDIGR